MLLVDHEIRWFAEHHEMIVPYSPPIQDGVISFGESHCGYDLRLGNKVLIFKNTFSEVIDPKRFKQDAKYMERVFDTIENIPTGEGVIIPPNSYILGFTLEYIRMPKSLQGICVGKSSYARCGVLLNTTPLEPGWHGHLTLEIGNLTPCPVKIYVGEGIAQLLFNTLSATVESDYSGKKYQAQTASPIPARIK